MPWYQGRPACLGAWRFLPPILGRGSHGYKRHQPHPHPPPTLVFIPTGFLRVWPLYISRFASQVPATPDARRPPLLSILSPLALPLLACGPPGSPRDALMPREVEDTIGPVLSRDCPFPGALFQEALWGSVLNPDQPCPSGVIQESPFLWG